MSGHAKVEDFSSSVADHEPGVQQTKLNVGDDDEVHRGDAVFVISEERLPSLTLIAVGTSPREISRDGGETDRDSELLEFCSDLSGAPAVLIRESTDEGLNLRRDRRSSGSRPRDGSPVEPKTLAMPADDGVGLDDDQGVFPIRPDL